MKKKKEKHVTFSKRLKRSRSTIRTYCFLTSSNNRSSFSTSSARTETEQIRGANVRAARCTRYEVPFFSDFSLSSSHTPYLRTSVLILFPFGGLNHWSPFSVLLARQSGVRSRPIARRRYIIVYGIYEPCTIAHDSNVYDSNTIIYVRSFWTSKYFPQSSFAVTVAYRIKAGEKKNRKVCHRVISGGCTNRLILYCWLKRVGTASKVNTLRLIRSTIF